MNEKNILANVNLSLTLKDVIDIAEINHLFTLKVFISKGINNILLLIKNISLKNFEQFKK